MSAFKKYMKRFVKEEEGAETIETVAILAVIAGVLVVVLGIIKAMLDRSRDAALQSQEQFGSTLDDLLGTPNGNNSGAQP